MSGLVTVDDLEFDKIHYIDVDGNNFWNRYLASNDPNVWEGELREVVNAGPSALFTFTGSQVSVFGRVEPATNGSQQPLSLYSVGSQNLQAFVAPDVTTIQDNVAFFNSSVMPYDQYTLIINVSRASANAPYFLDYIRFNTTNPNTGVSSSNLTSSTISTSSATSSASASFSAKSTSAPVGAIVGGVVGGVAVVAATTLAFFCYRLRKRGSRKYVSQSMEEKRASPTRITPYVVPAIAGSQSRFEDIRSPPNGSGDAASFSMAQHGSTHSFGYGAPSGKRSKAALARVYDQGIHSLTAGPASMHGGGSVHESGSTSHSVNGSGTDSASGAQPDGSSQARPTHTPSPHSTVHDLPNITNTARNFKMRAALSERTGHPNVVPSASTSLSPAQQDSGMRFQPGVTPSDVAPVLPPGAPGPIRSAATRSEVARADIPPAYTPE